jgi:hypothetical protein
MGAVKKLNDCKCLSFSPLPSRFNIVHGVHYRNAPEAFYVGLETFQYFYEQFASLKDEVSEAEHPHYSAGGWVVYASGVYVVYHSI